MYKLHVRSWHTHNELIIKCRSGNSASDHANTIQIHTLNLNPTSFGMAHSCYGIQLGWNVYLDYAKLIPCSMEHQGNEVGSVGRKENN